MKRKAIALFIAVTMILWTAAPSFAAAETREISASYSGITLCIDLEPVTLLDANGNAVAPFIADGTTYLPVRAISEALGMDVVWEADTKSVRISEKSDPTDTAETDKAPAEDAAATEEKAAATEEKTAATEDTDAAKDAEKSELTENAAATEEKTDAVEEGDAIEEKADAEPTDAEVTEKAPESFIGTKALSVTYNDIAIYVNDVKISPKDAGGNAVEPFIADGTTYLPVRAVAEALGLTVSWDGSTKSIYVGEQPEKAAAPADNAAYAKYLAAEAAIEAADSFANEISGNAVTTIDGEKTEMQLTGSAKFVKHSATDIEFVSDTTTVIAGESIAASAYYKDGVVYIKSDAGKVKMALPLNEALAQVQTSGIDIEADAIKEQSADGDTITFTLDGGKLLAAADTVLGNLKSVLPTSGAYTLGDIVCTVTLDEKGALKDVKTVFSLDLILDGETATLAYDLTTSYTQVGGVNITAPADLSSYEELEPETK
jgi:hypothetical protein